MDGRCVYLFLLIFIINFLSVTNGEKIYIRDSLKVKPFDNRLGTKQLYSVVVNALKTRYKNRKMLEVSKSRYAFHTAWRGIKNFFWEKVLNVFCPSITRELKAIRVLKDALVKSNSKNGIQNKFGFTIPFKKKQNKAKKKTSEENSDEESDEESEEESEEGSSEESDEESDEESNAKGKKKTAIKGKNAKNSKKKEESDEDDDDSDSDEEDNKKKKTNKKSLDDLFK
ncbi:LOW QUALITY PROTEIN: probable ATP-dependent RNA helicase ddx52 [Metopolophium dirhodum]|uniref:LOW QUALITY PROTEIN: probable ATP-dependent RNA helicase ddx52 n=1 Tax=Metopolophium dirhodum TaxID=44670 RepID=UPI00298F801E|nr:LOW QUALITY PROTEIN: probable ATP-dependent RNA helicase ddx52 [Metopolophium dirhodum]